MNDKNKFDYDYFGSDFFFIYLFPFSSKLLNYNIKKLFDYIINYYSFYLLENLKYKKNKIILIIIYFFSLLF
jgi:hypothetical protein